MEWLLLYRNLPIEIRDFLEQHLGNLSDFISTDYNSGIFTFASPSTCIEITYAFEMGGQLLIIWPPGVDDPTEEDYMIFHQNSFEQEIAI